MNRRQVMQGMTATLVAALSPEILISSATAGGLADQVVDAAGLPAWLDALDAQVQRMRARQIAPVARAWYTGLGLRETAPVDVAESLFRVAAYRDLPESLQAHPEVQRRMHAELPRLGQQVLAMTRLLRDLPEGSRKSVRRLLRDNPDLSEALRHRQSTAMRASGAPEERIAQTDRLLERVHFRLRRQHPSLLLDELVDKVRRASADAGVAEHEWDALIAVDLDGVASEDGATDEAPATSTAAEPDPYDHSHWLLRASVILAAIGGGLFLLGLGTMVISEIGMVLTIAGGVVLLVSLVVLGIALVAYIIEAASESSSADASYLLPDDFIAAVRGGAVGLYQPDALPA